ncbi:hypothetical protein ACHAQA_002250 [Verticillium albo-atrum]
MPLTPLKVRGKRNSAAKKKRSTPYDRPAPPTAPLRRSRPRKKSLLERQLPLEILERIFYLSENLAFPRCSPLLGRLLSGRQTLVGAAMAAFGPTWAAWYGVDLRRAHGFRWKSSLDPAETARCRAIEDALVPGNPDFQSAILACPWATLPALLEAQSQWARRFARDRPPPAALDEDEHEDEDENKEARPPQQQQQRQEKQPCLYHDVHPRTRIPDLLVSGPWTHDDALLLRWLRRGGARFHAAQSWELKLRGLRAAVTARSPRRFDPALARALCLMGDFFWDRDDKTPRLGRTADRHAITDEWPRAVLAEELDRVDDLREWWRARGGGEPDELVRLAYLMETGLGENVSSGPPVALERLVRR